MTCAEFESILADYVDSTLPSTAAQAAGRGLDVERELAAAEEPSGESVVRGSSRSRTAVELHAAQCAHCREFMTDVAAIASLLERVEDVDAPAELITRIAYQAPQGRTRDYFEAFGFWSEWKSKWLEPFLQPRLAMGMAMTVLSFSMLARCTGAPVQHIQAADLNPGRILENLEDRALRTRDRIVKNYENLRVVYDIESRLNDIEQQAPASPPANRDQSKPKTQGARK